MIFSGVRIGLAVLLMAVCGHITIPGVLVPFTLSTYMLIVLLCVLPFYEGIVSISLYLLLGLVGVFSFSKGKAGVEAFFGPTGGYLVGFLVVALLSQKIQSWFGITGGIPLKALQQSFYVGLLMHGIILAFGSSYLAFLKGAGAAWVYGLKPFFIPAVLKSLFAAGTVVVLHRVFKTHF